MVNGCCVKSVQMTDTNNPPPSPISCHSKMTKQKDTHTKKKTMSASTFYSGKRTEWSPIRSVIIRGITKSDDREVGV